MAENLQEESKTESKIENRYEADIQQNNIAYNGGIIVDPILNTNPSLEKREVKKIIDIIMGNMGNLQSDKRDELSDVLSMIEAEYKKPVFSKARINNCISMLSNFVTLATGTPALVNAIGTLIDSLSGQR